MSKDTPWPPTLAYVRKRFENQIELWKKQDGLCCYCGIPLLVQPSDKQPRGRYSTLEHKHPRSLGGNSNIDNLALACYTCNKKKGDLTETQFLKTWPVWIAKKKYDDSLNKYQPIPVEHSLKLLQEKYDDYLTSFNQRKVQGESVCAYRTTFCAILHSNDHISKNTLKKE